MASVSESGDAQRTLGQAYLLIALELVVRACKAGLVRMAAGPVIRRGRFRTRPRFGVLRSGGLGLRASVGSGLAAALNIAAGHRTDSWGAGSSNITMAVTCGRPLRGIWCCPVPRLDAVPVRRTDPLGRCRVRDLPLSNNRAAQRERRERRDRGGQPTDALGHLDPFVVIAKRLKAHNSRCKAHEVREAPPARNARTRGMRASRPQLLSRSECRRCRRLLRRPSATPESALRRGR